MTRTLPLILLALLAQGWTTRTHADENAKLPTPQEMKKWIDAELDRDLRLWYPLSVDTQHGGYHSIIDRDWTLQPYETKGIVQQARMAWVAAEVALRRPEWRAELTPVALNGLRFLKDSMWDKKYGGFYWEVKADGTPLTDSNSEMKHAYGISFAIYGLANVYRLTGDKDALNLAVETFRWLDKHGYDRKNGGYIEAFYRDGTPMLASPADRPDVVKGKTRELLGCKSMNTHLHLLEAYTELYKVWKDDTLRARLEELLVIMRDKVTTWPGAMRQFFRADWTPAATFVSFGHDIECAYLMEEALEVLGRPEDAATLKVCKDMVDHSLEFGFDYKYGGFFYDGATFGAPADTTKFWWVQAEGLNTLSRMYLRYGETRYYRDFVLQWDFLSKHILDAEYGGWYPVTDADGANPRGLDSRFSQVTRGLEKAHLWKTAYHEVRALLNVSDTLEKIIAKEKK
ncbi:MAG: AGE family epimerase/isomerase [Planctomycetia bacterium]|nr:AGE family epimerase/isomerase [Planctomycetia bacterium]